jgi:FeS assembly SUF system protein
MITEEQLIEKLKQILDPELHISVWDLGLIYKTEIKDNGDVFIEMTLTTPGCPLMTTIPLSVKNEVMKIEGVGEVDVKLVWNPPWKPEMLSDEAKKRLGIET